VIEELNPLCVDVEKIMKVASDVGIPVMHPWLKPGLTSPARYELDIFLKDMV
jgi:hypothetical protein